MLKKYYENLHTKDQLVNIFRQGWNMKIDISTRGNFKLEVDIPNNQAVIVTKVKEKSTYGKVLFLMEMFKRLP